MQNFKISNFYRIHPGEKFPEVSHLGPGQCNRIRERISAVVRGRPESSPLDLVRTLSERAVAWVDRNASDPDFQLSQVLASLGVTSKDRVFINWYRFDDIDQILLSDLIRYFDDIWYPGSDDIEIFDDSLTWMLLVRHDGLISAIKRDETNCSCTAQIG